MRKDESEDIKFSCVKEAGEGLGVARGLLPLPPSGFVLGFPESNTSAVNHIQPHFRGEVFHDFKVNCTVADLFFFPFNNFIFVNPFCIEILIF